MKYFKITVLAALISNFAIAGSVQVYGTADVSIQSVGKGKDGFTDIRSNSSRFGVQGFHKVNEQIVAVFNYEVGIDLTDESSENNIKSRNQYVGMSGQFGEVVLGRNDTALRLSQGNVDLFHDTTADIKGLWAGESRVDNSITFSSNFFYSTQVIATYVAEESVENDAGYSVAVKYGDIKLMGTPMFLSAAFDTNIDGFDSTRFTAQTSYDKFTFGFAYHHQEEILSGDAKDGFLLSMTYPVQSITTKAQIQTLEDTTVLTFGSDFKLSPSTKVYSWYSVKDGGEDDDKSTFSIGIQHTF
jgi:predicted porin